MKLTANILWNYVFECIDSLNGKIEALFLPSDSRKHVEKKLKDRGNGRCKAPGRDPRAIQAQLVELSPKTVESSRVKVIII